MKKRVVIAGFGDTGLLVAIHLKKHYEVIGISSKPCLVSGQELGTRLTRLESWKQNYLVDFKRYKALAGVEVKQAEITSLDTESKQLSLIGVDGRNESLSYDLLVIASGTSNGFWRNAQVQTQVQIEQGLAQRQAQIAQAQSIAVVGGGPTGVSVASNIKEVYPQKKVRLFYSQELPLPGYHPKTREKIAHRLQQQGVETNSGYRAQLPQDKSLLNELHGGTVEWQTGQEAVEADLILWAVGNCLPNNHFLPSHILDQQGFVKVDQYLKVPGVEDVFAVGDIAASDPNRSSARNAGFLTLAHNIHTYLSFGNRAKLKAFKATEYRWGSVLGVQDSGMKVFTPNGLGIRVPLFWVRVLLFPFFVRQMIYKGVGKIARS